MDNNMWFWIVFNVAVLALLFVDLYVFHRKEREIEMKEALLGSAFWIGLALFFNLAIYYFRGTEDAVDFFTGYLIEYSLSIDNLFVFFLIFNYFQVPKTQLHRVLFWGILGAIVMRTLFIALGIALISTFSWILYLFGAFLVITGIKLAFEKDKKINPEKNLMLILFKKLMPVTQEYVGSRFFVLKNQRWFATPLLIVLLTVETTDVIFAVDSIPAIMAITLDPVIIYTSNIFAILGLRSLYFALSHLMSLFHHLHYGLALILTFVGVKMLLSGYAHLPNTYSLMFIVITLFLSVLASLLFPKKEKSNPTH